MSASLFDLYVAELCPDEFREMVRTSNDYADVLDSVSRWRRSRDRNRLLAREGEKGQSQRIGRGRFQRTI
jgi:hypothetical protein